MIPRPSRGASQRLEPRPEPAMSSGHDRRSYTTAWGTIRQAARRLGEALAKWVVPRHVAYFQDTVEAGNMQLWVRNPTPKMSTARATSDPQLRCRRRARPCCATNTAEPIGADWGNSDDDEAASASARKRPSGHCAASVAGFVASLGA
jgi:hypothetical protein